jgi:hypothetical protein
MWFTIGIFFGLVSLAFLMFKLATDEKTRVFIYKDFFGDTFMGNTGIDVYTQESIDSYYYTEFNVRTAVGKTLHLLGFLTVWLLIIIGYLLVWFLIGAMLAPILILGGVIYMYIRYKEKQAVKSE